MPYVGITTIAITASNQCLNLGDVQLYYQGIQISTSILTFNLSFTGNWCSSAGIALGTQSLPCYASFCNDGNLSTICHGGCSAADRLRIQLSQPTLVDQVVIYNRLDSGQSRLNGASVVAADDAGTVWSTTIPSTSANSYSFKIGND